MPAHVTVLFPFVEPTEVDEEVVATLAAAVAGVSAFACRFERTRRFDEDVLWLDPEPNEPFRLLTSIVWGAFPQHLPYEGVHEDVVPHLTVADGQLTDLPSMDAAEREVRKRLPLSSRIDRLLLIEGTRAPDSWRLLHTMPLRT